MKCLIEVCVESAVVTHDATNRKKKKTLNMVHN